MNDQENENFKRTNLFALCLCLCLAGGTTARAEPASDASVRELMVVTEAEKLISGAYEQLDGAMRAGVQQALGDREITVAQRQIIEEAQAETIAVLKSELAWAKLEPQMTEIYRSNFSEAEVQGMLQFYRSDVGKAVIAKMPAVMQSAMQITQQQMVDVVPALQQIQEKMVTRLKALCPDGSEPGAAGCKSS